MSDRSDPSFHRDREKEFFAHAQRLLEDDRLRPETRFGRRPITSLMTQVNIGERGVERGERLKRLMLEMGVADRQLQANMPVGERLSVYLSQRVLFFFKAIVGRLHVVCTSPSRELLRGETPTPLDAPAVNQLIADSTRGISDQIPITTVLMSTSGFSDESRALINRTGNRPIVLAEPNDAGGWTIHAPPDAPELAQLFDPEQDEAKRARVRQYLQDNHYELISAGVGADRVAAKTQLPLQIVEAELKSFARENVGLAAKRIEGRLTLFREGSATVVADSGGLSNMPFWERVKGIFKREESTEKKIARLATERAALGAQRERAYDEIAAVERREAELTKSFTGATALAQRRIATEISQLRKDIERRQQILGTIDKKINVINTGIHTLELKQHVDPEKLKSLENIAASSEDVEEGMAALQQLDEEANSVAGIGTTDVPDDVQAILDELRGKADDESTAATEVTGTIADRKVTDSKPKESDPATPSRPITDRRHSEPEAG